MKSLRTRTELAATRIRRWWPWLLVSLVVHLPLTPLGPLLGLLGLLVRLRGDLPVEPVEDLVGIPVELLQAPASEPPTVPADTATSTDATVIAPTKPKPRKPKVTELPDAGVSDASVADAGLGTTDGGIADAGLGPADGGLADAGIGSADGGLADAATPDGGAGSESDAGTAPRDPFAIAGNFPTPPKTNVNVKIHLFTANLANHPAGSAIAALLGNEPQWADFLGPGGLDPVRDISRIALYGPQLVDSSKVAVFLEYSIETATVKQAVDALVKRTEGAHWATENKKRVAYVKAAGAERVIIFFPGKLIAIVPPGPVATQLLQMEGLPTLPAANSSAEVFQGALRTPHRVRFLRNIGIDIPVSIAEARVFVSSLPNGGATINLALVDESSDAAQAHLADLERQASALTMGFVVLNFSREGKNILANARLSPLQIAAILGRINSEVAAQRRRVRPTP